MIEKINPQTSYKWMEHKHITDKINEIIDVINRMCRILNIPAEEEPDE